MKSYEEHNKKQSRKKDHKRNKKNQFFDEDRFIENKINKEYKYKKKYLHEDDDETDEWESYR